MRSPGLLICKRTLRENLSRTVIGAFKSIVAVQWLAWLRENAPMRSGRIWQRGYYEKIIRNERQLNAVRQYIVDNPRRWAEDRDNLDDVIERMDART
jgi:putative transposase